MHSKTIKSAICLALLTLLASTALSGCGFALRGYDKEVLDNTLAVLEVENGTANRELIKQTTLKLLVLGAQVESDYNKLNKLSRPNTQSNVNQRVSIKVSQVQRRKIELVGTLSEVQLLLSAHVAIMDSTHELIRDISVQRTYQYDAATVNTENQQQDIIIQRMNEELAARIARQVALFQAKH